MVQQQANTQAKKRGAGLMTALGVTADISAVAVLVFSQDFTLFVQFASIAGIAAGVFLLFRQWGRPVGMRVLLAIACITAGSVVATLSLAESGPGALAKSSGESKALQPRLTPHEGIDLDAKDPKPVDTDGPNGDIDLFMDKYGYLRANNGAFYVDPEGPDSEIYNRCSRALTAQRDPDDEVLPEKGVRLCFKTTAGKVGWLSVNDANFSGQGYAVLNVRLW